MQRPAFDNLQLQPCCHRQLNDIKRRMKLARILQSVLAASPFILIFGSGPVEVVAADVAGIGILSTDWDTWAKAVKSVRPIVRNRCRQVAGLHALDHPGGDLNRFWRALYDHYA